MHVVDLNLLQQSQYLELLEESRDEPMFYGKPLDPKRDRQIVLNKDGDVVGAFEFTRTYWEGRYYWRTNRPYVFKKYRGQGLLVPALTEWYSDRRPALAWIDEENIASIRLFFSLGFTRDKPYVMHGKQGHFYVLS
ncbi:hypothetical protein [Ralstonia phage RSL2]|uniref:N-acetyltransferase domain-containing protein n=1 Tax=Ralstonia phage RSL2 TaxID=1585840 RepID=A0A146I576_9CAUD|nr:hypothetical protein [Ralstonia phage RSL2]